MRTRNLSIAVLVLLAISAVTALAAPVELYLVKFAPGTDVYRLAGSQNWPVYHISGQQALIGKQISKSDNNAVLESNRIYQGPSENLRWVHLKRNSQLPAMKIVYSGKDMLLAESGSVTAAGVKSGRDYMVKPFNSQPMPISPSAIIRNTSLVRDTAVAALTHLVDTAQVRTRIEALQSFNTRFYMAANHDSVAGWIRNQFLTMGITDVELDTFYTVYSGAVPKYNVVATIPGLLDTSVVYIVGGHYDSYSDRRYSDPLIKYSQAPGADDNASGTGAVLEMARVLAQPGNRPNCTVRFIAFDAEEYGLFGSEYYAQQALAEGMDIGCMLNYDMIGYKGNDSIFVSKLYPGSVGYAYMLGQMAGW
ncbi:MAG: M20/M25/M40 family metallo-hydrolase, partial [bacterium]|nr:M20/M25/M40 family metallo-hydrolase [bacterium]